MLAYESQACESGEEQYKHKHAIKGEFFVLKEPSQPLRICNTCEVSPTLEPCMSWEQLLILHEKLWLGNYFSLAVEELIWINDLVLVSLKKDVHF